MMNQLTKIDYRFKNTVIVKRLNVNSTYHTHSASFNPIIQSKTANMFQIVAATEKCHVLLQYLFAKTIATVSKYLLRPFKFVCNFNVL